MFTAGSFFLPFCYCASYRSQNYCIGMSPSTNLSSSSVLLRRLFGFACLVLAFSLSSMSNFGFSASSWLSYKLWVSSSSSCLRWATSRACFMYASFSFCLFLRSLAYSFSKKSSSFIRLMAFAKSTVGASPSSFCEFSKRVFESVPLWKVLLLSEGRYSKSFI